MASLNSYGFFLVHKGIGASRKPCDDTFCGIAPESEKETKALADFIRGNLSTIKAYLTIHSYSQLLLYPYSYTFDVTKDNVELVRNKMASVLKGCGELASLASVWVILVFPVVLVFLSLLQKLSSPRSLNINGIESYNLTGPMWLV